MSTQEYFKRHRSRIIRAILAGGLVFGIGAAVTLSAWNDSEFVSSTFTAGTFSLEGSTTDGTTNSFTDHATSPGGALAFTIPATGLSPNTSVDAPFAVRLAANTTTAANVVLTTEAPGGSIAHLTYQLDIMDSWGCGGTSTSTPISGATLDDGTTSFTLPIGSPVSTAGAPVYLCFEVEADGGLVQGQSGTATWNFTASSL